MKLRTKVAALLVACVAACQPARAARSPDAPVARPASDPAPGLAERFAWLQGAWVAEADGRRESETWVARDDGLVGTSESRVGHEVVHRESIVIERRGDTIVYEAHPSSQPPHAFTLVDDGPGRARFEDPAHDWPQVIEYVRDGDTLTATVGGTKDGLDRTATWTWTLAP